MPGQAKKIPRDTSFPESPAILRTQAGMSTFLELERDVNDYLMHEAEVDPSDPALQQLKDRLLQYAVSGDEDKDMSLFGDWSSTMDGEAGTKRKLYVYRFSPLELPPMLLRNGYSDDRPRKRARLQNPAEKNVVELWWDVMRSEDMLSNGVPSFARSRSEDAPVVVPPPAIMDPPRETKRRKKKKDVSKPNTLLYHMNNNVRTLRRVRTTHAKFTALTQSLEEGGTGVPPSVNDIPDEGDDVLDERPWKPVGHGIEMGEEHANDCLHWMGGKVLEHVGFQGEHPLPRLYASIHVEDLQEHLRWPWMCYRVLLLSTC